MNFHSYQHSKSEKKSPFTSSSRNPLNSFLFEKLSKLKSIAETRGLKNQAFCYTKILRSLSKYPLPILSVSQAIELEGIGDKTALLLLKLIKKQYESCFLAEKSNEVNLSNFSNFSNLSNFSQIRETQSQGFEKVNFFEKVDLNEDFETNEENLELSNLELSNFNFEYSNPLKRPLYTEKTSKDLELFNKKPLLERELSKFSKEKEKANEGLKITSKYKLPDAESTPGTIILALMGFQGETNGKYATKKEIKKIAEELAVKCGEISHWSCLKTLIKHEILFSFEFDGIEKFCLSEEGEKMGEKLLEKQLKIMEKTGNSQDNSIGNEYSFTFREKERDLGAIIEKNSSEEKTTQKNHVKKDDFSDNDKNNLNVIKSIEKSDFTEKSKRKTKEKSIEKSSKKNEEEKFLMKNIEKNSKRNDEKKSLKKITDQITHRNFEKIPFETSQEIREKPITISVPLDSIEALNVVLIIDNREIKNQDDRTYIHEHLLSNGLDCELGNLPLGDFLWIVRIKEKGTNEIKLFVLEYIVERKTCDDLAASIIDGRYTNQRSRLKRSQIHNAFYLIEGKSSQNSSLPSHVIEKAVFNLQFVHGFKVQRTVNLQNTLKWLSQMTISIQKFMKIQMKNAMKNVKKSIDFRLTLEDFLAKNGKTCNSIGEIFKNMLINIKGCGKKACNEIVQRYKTPNLLYEALMGLGNYEERIELLSLKARKNKKKFDDNVNNINIPAILAKRFVVLLCEDGYPDIVVEENEDDLEEDL